MMKAAGMALRHAEHDASLAQALRQRLAQVGHAQRGIPNGAPFAVALFVPFQSPQVDHAFGIGAATLRAVVADEQVQRSPVCNRRQNLFTQRFQKNVALRRAVAVHKTREPGLG